MCSDMRTRAKQLLELASLSDLATPNSSEYVRWQNIKRGRARFSPEEIERLGQVMPDYRWWLLTGEEWEAIGQISPMREKKADLSQLYKVLTKDVNKFKQTLKAAEGGRSEDLRGREATSKAKEK